MYKRELTGLALLAFFVGLVMTGLGGWADMVGKPLLITKQHAWNDGLILMVASIFLVLLARQ